ncbi:MAG: CPBP family intramembrane metalloprotease [Gemmatimonadetes bacterium]|nr:CPBP family intramembrane metalloprotease [Gemmatimonadota bacterium]
MVQREVEPSEWGQWIFFNEKRLRSGWRIALFFALLAVFVIVGQLMVSLLPPETTFWVIPGLLLVATLTAGLILLVRLDGRPAGALGFAVTRTAGRETGWGLLLGGGLLGAAVLLLFVTGSAYWVSDTGTATEYLAALVGSFLFFAVAAAFEEALFRGYPFQVLVEGIGTWPAVLLSSAVFSWAHAQNPEITVLAFVNIFLAGVLLALAYLRTRSLWFATAVHLGWNWAMAFLLDFPVSGLTGFDTPLYSGVAEGAEWWTGGGFGPEAGLSGTLVLLAGIGWLLRTKRLSETPEMQALGPVVDRRLPPGGL